MEEDEDDIYAPAEPDLEPSNGAPVNGQTKLEDDDVEEMEEDESDSVGYDGRFFHCGPC